MKIYRLVYSPIEVNTYIVDNEDGSCAIIDCGCYSDEEFVELKAFLDEKGLKPVMLLNTHLHLDHIFGNGRVFKEYGLLTHASALEESNRQSASSHALLFGMTMDEPPVIGKTVSENELIKFGNTEFKALFVPGHTAGSIAYYIEKEEVVFTGDALFRGSIGRTDLPGGSYDTLIDSIRTKLLCLDPDTVIYPGHGNDSTIDNEKQNNPYIN